MTSTSHIVHVPSEAASWPIAADWARLDDLCDGVFDCPHTTPKLTAAGPFVVRSQDVRTGIFRLDQAGRVSEETYLERIDRAEPRHGDLLFSREGTYFGNAAEVPSGVRVCLGQRMVLIRPKRSKLNSRFLRFWLNSPLMAKHIAGFKDGSVAERLNMPTIRALPVPRLHPERQLSIASVLGALDDKIELNRRVNETLEATARVIFKDWFVDFGPTRAKLEGSGPYLAPEIWSLFPDALNERGNPEGWDAFRLDQLAIHHTRGLSPLATPEAEFEHFSLPAYDSGQSPAIDRGSQIKSNKTIMPPDSILLSKLNPEIERVWIPEREKGRQQICSTEFLVFTTTNMSNRSILFGIFTDSGFRAMLHSMVTGTSNSHQRISPPNLLQREVLTASHTVISQYDVIAAKLLQKILSNRAESRTLAATRDFLLPRLMSGEVRVREAEKVVEATV